MVKCFVPKAVLTIVLSVVLSGSAFAQLYSPPPSTPAPTTPAPAPAPTPTPTAAPTAAPTPTTTSAAAPTVTTTAAATPAATPTATAATVTTTSATIPGYSTSSSYGPGRTIGYVIAPFAVVAATYFIGHHHQLEIHPNAGFIWPRHVDFADTKTSLRDEGMYGLKVGVMYNDNIEVEGNFGYMNHFESRIAPTVRDQFFGVAPTTVHGLLYDLNGVWNFGKHPVLGSRFAPYVTGGVGGLSTLLENGSAAVIGGEFYRPDPVTGVPVFNPTHTVVVHDHTAFFSVNYGAGIKGMKVWGPVGFRADIRGRTFPNFRGESLTWPEATAGLVFTIGER